MPPNEIKIAEKYLKSVDARLGKLISGQKLLPRTPRNGYFQSLCRSIVGQQVSVAAAATIFARLEAITKLQPEAVAKLDENQIKVIGLSRQKASYIKDLALHFVGNPEIYDHLESQSDEQVIEELTAVKGVGTWTAQMFLMFTLSRPDVFAPDDIGLQRAIQKVYGLNGPLSKQELKDMAENWRPFRTVACYHLWQSLDNEPVQASD